jgi:hypothetical protein
MIPGTGVATAVALFKRLWPVAAVVGVALAIWVYGNSRAHDAKMAERAEWHKELAKARVMAVEKALQQQAAVDAANSAASAAQARLDALAGQEKGHRHAYYVNRPVVRCLDPERLRAIKEGDAAAAAAITAN